MSSPERQPRDWKATLEVAAPWGAGLLLALPVLVAFYPPMTDLPFHEAAIGLLRARSDPARVPPGLYRLNLGEPNQLFHMAGWALSYLVSTRWAVKLLVAAAVVALPVSAARFARHLGASPLAALVVAPMGLGWLFSWGLITNLLGLSALLAVLPLLDRLAERPTRRLVLAALGANVLLYFAHEAMMFVFAGIALGLAILHRGSLRVFVLRASPFVSGVAIAVAQVRWQAHFMTPVVGAMPRMWRPLLVKLKEIPYIVLPATDLAPQLAMLALTVLAVALFFGLRAAERRQAPAPEPEAAAPAMERTRVWALAHRWELVAGLGFFAFATFPVSLSGATLVHERWFPPAFAILAVVAAPRDLWARPARVARIALFMLPLATLAAAWPAFIDADREYRALEPLLAQVEPGSAVAGVDLGPPDKARGYSLGPASGRILATQGGRLAYAFTDSPVSPMVLARRYQWTESLVRIGFDTWRLMPSHDLERFRYVLLRAQDPGLAWMASYSLAAEAEYVAESGHWVLFRSKLPVVPVTSPDVALPDPVPQTLRQRINLVVSRLRRERGLPVEDPPPERDPHSFGPGNPQ